MKKVLLVGVGGYVGGKFIEYINKHYPDWQLESVDSIERKWEKTDFHGYDAVFNVSGLAHANARQGSEQEYYAVNGQLPIDIAARAKEASVPMFIQMSSQIVYGDMSDLGTEKVITEFTVPSEPTVYGKSKMMAERGLQELSGPDFQVAIIRSPLIYSECARDNFPRLVSFAKKMPVFPMLENQQSMIYIDNICELVRLIIDNNKGGIYFPQQEVYIQTSKIVKDIAEAVGNRIWITRIFNPALRIMSRVPMFSFIRKAFGNIVYDMEISNHFDGTYRVVSYEQSIERIAKI